MGSGFKFMLVACVATQLCGCLPLAIASVMGVAGGGAGGPSAKGTNSAPFRDNTWIKDKGPELYQTTEAAVLEECTRQLEALADMPVVDGAGKDRGTTSCTYRKRCLPGNRAPVDLLVCAAADRSANDQPDRSEGAASVSNWDWAKLSSVEPRPGED